MLLLLSFQFIRYGEASRVSGFGYLGTYSESQAEALQLQNNGNWVVSNNKKDYVFDLFSNASDGQKLTPYFGAQFDSLVTWGVSNESKYYADGNYYRYYRTEAGNGSPKNGKIYSDFTISSALKQAGVNGFLTVTATSTFGSGSYASTDRPDNVSMSFAGQTKGTTVSNVKYTTIVTETQKVWTDYKYQVLGTWIGGFVDQEVQVEKELDYQAAVDASGNPLTEVRFTNQSFSTTGNVDSYRLEFVTDLIKSDSDASITKNTLTTLFIQDPTITLTTADISAPTLTVTETPSKSEYSLSKKVTISLADSQAGIDISRLSVIDETGATIETANSVSGDTKTATATFDYDKNNKTYEIVAYDNVGNASAVYSYTTEGIEDTTPTISVASVENAEIFTKEKLVTLNIADPQSGIKKVLINGTEIKDEDLIFGEGRNTATAKFVVNENNKDYLIEVFDMFDLKGEFTYTSSFIDIVAPSVTLDFEENQRYKSKHVVFSATIDTSIIQSNPEEYYFTFDGTDPATSQTRIPLVNGENSFMAEEEKTYTIRVFARDALGNTMAEVSKPLLVALEYVKYAVYNSIAGTDTLAESNDHIALGSLITFAQELYDQEKNITYILYKVMINGVENGVLSNLNLTELDTQIYLVYREVVDIQITNTQFDFTGSVQNVTYSVLIKSLNQEYAGEGLTVNYTKNGEPTELNEAGIYGVEIVIDDDNYLGSVTGELNVLIPLDFTLTNSYIYSDITFKLIYGLSANIDAVIEVKNPDGEVVDLAKTEREPLDAGSYTYTYSISNPLYYLKNHLYGAGEAFATDTLDFGTKALTGTFVIAEKEITLSNYTGSKVYDGEIFTFPASFGGYEVKASFTLNGEEASPRLVGTYQVNLTVTQKNYCGSGKGTYTITRRALTVVADAKSSEYGEALAELTYRTPGAGFVEGDSFTFTPITNLLPDTRNVVDTYTITFVPENTTTGVLANYEITYIDANYTITPKEVYVSASAGQNKIYGEMDPEKFTYRTDGVYEGDELNVVLTRVEGEVVGLYEITLVSYENPNYTVVYTSDNFRITERKLIISANRTEKVYDGTTAQPENLAKNYRLVYGEIAERDINNFGFALTANMEANVGRYQINPVSLEIENYNIVFMTNYVYVVAKPVTISALAQTKQYGEADPKFTYLLDNEPVEEGLFSGSLTRVPGEEVGSYAIKLGSLKNKNYDVTFESANLTITKAELTVTILNASKVYGTTLDPKFTFTNNKGVPLHLISGQMVRVEGENVGEYKISGSFNSNNYNISVVEGTFKITPRTAYLTLADLSKVYGKADPEFVYSFSEVRPADLEGLESELVISRENGENVGEYLITAECIDENYNIVIGSSKLTIQKAPSLLTISGKTFTYDGEAKTLTASLNVEGDIVYRITKNGESVESAVNFGEYRVEAEFVGNQNFLGSSAIANLVILKADVPVTVYKNVFVMKKDGSIQDPLLTSPLEKTEYRIVFEDPNAGSVGVHSYTIVFNNPNYNSLSGTVEILPIPATTTSGGSVEFVEGEVSSNKVDLTIQNTEEKKKVYIGENLAVDKTYEIKYNQTGEAQVKVELDYASEDYSNVYVYAYNDKGESRLVPYVVENGKLVLNMDAENVKLAIVREVATISLLTVGVIAFGALYIGYLYARHLKKKKTRKLLRVA